jgi:hypothetical protein
MRVKITELPAVFLSYDEPYRDIFFKSWSELFSVIHRVHGVTGLNSAHLKACESVNSDYFVLIDADAYPLVNRIINECVEIDEKLIVSNLQSIQGVTHTITPHGGIKIINKRLATDFFTTAKSICPKYELQQGFTVISGKPLSIEFSNQSPELAFTSAYNDSSLLLRATITPISYLKNPIISKLTGKRQRIWPWLTVGAEEPNGLYSILGAHTAVNHVTTGMISTTIEGIENYKNQHNILPKLDNFEHLMSELSKLSTITMMPIKPHHIFTDFISRVEELSSKYSEY